MPIRRFAPLILLALMVACTRRVGPTVAPQVEIVRVYITATPLPTWTASLTPTETRTPAPTRTPTPTSTPTPTAPAIVAVGNPRAYTLFEPLPQSGAPCGWVDTLDFPLGPPDGASAAGGGDFGAYRDRYEKYHAGEDWGLLHRGNFGQPVHSIGHGQVTYTQPLGWGADKGVVIIRHTFPDGRSLLSFYGHLDPPGVILPEGACVQRGEIVGQIGRPRTPPHLHFEIRSHMPYATGGGYWPSDPVRAGWLPPSQTISQYRLQIAPGTLWTTAFASSKPLGNLDATTYLMIQEDHFVGVELLTGDQTWSYPLTTRIKDALFDPARDLLYISDSVDGLLAYPLPAVGEDEPPPDELEPLWAHNLPSSGRMDLMPLPGGGVLVSHRDTLSAFSFQGDLLWEEDADSYLHAWALAEDSLLFTTSDDETPLMSADAEGLYVWDENLPGIPLVAGDQAWLYAYDGLYRLDLAARTAQRRYDLPTTLMRRSTALPLSNGGLILLHADTADRRLLAFDIAGELQWEFSVSLDGNAQLFELDGEIYLLTQPAYAGRGAYGTVEIFAVDLESEQLLRIFEGGSRTYNPRATWAAGIDDGKFLIQIAGAGGFLFDPQAAQKRMGQ